MDRMYVRALYAWKDIAHFAFVVSRHCVKPKMMRTSKQLPLLVRRLVRS